MVSESWVIETELREHDPRGSGHYAKVLEDGSLVKSLGPFETATDAEAAGRSFIEERVKQSVIDQLGL